MTRLNAKQAKELGIDPDLSKIRRQKQQQGITVFQKLLTEAEVLRQVKDYLKAHGWYVFRVHQSALSHKGLSDLVAVRDGRVLFIECKSQHKRAKQSDEQAEFQREIEAHGGTYILARCIEDVKESIQDAG